MFAVLLLARLWVTRNRSSRALAAAGWGCLGTLIAVAVNQPVGHLFAEARPYATHPHLLVLATRTSDFSFPSDHAVMAGAATAGLLLVSCRLGWLLFRRPLTAVTTWLRRQPGISTVFADFTGHTPRQLTTGATTTTTTTARAR